MSKETYLAVNSAVINSYIVSRLLKLPHNIAAPAGMIGASNFFELAVAVAVALFGTISPAAFATTVGGGADRSAGHAYTGADREQNREAVLRQTMWICLFLCFLCHFDSKDKAIPFFIGNK